MSRESSYLGETSMQSSQALTDFQSHCQQHYICYSLAALGLLQFSSRLEELKADRTKSLIVGTGHPDDGRWQGVINLGTLLDSSQTDGVFPDTIAKAFVSTIYTMWDELYRHLVADEIGVSHKALKSDLMGDLRLVRNCIVHRKSVITDEGTRKRELAWPLAPGPLVISAEMFRLLIDQINKVAVRVEQ
jgi:hypothetical protein